MSDLPAVLMMSGMSAFIFSAPRPPTTSARPCAAPERSTLELSDVSVDISHGNSSSKLDSPMPFTMAPERKKN